MANIKEIARLANTVGVILPYSDHPCFDKIVNGITKAAFQHEYATTLLPTNYNPDIEIKYLELLRTKKIDGLIITSRANHWDSILAYQEYGPVIACDETSMSLVLLMTEKLLMQRAFAI
ncbi:transcriptional repressor of carbon supply (LacI family) protein [Bacillus subtilis]|uniref:Transcriptional repressor of carbon supply (LacI family) protein n=1 Tax=Bacillus subtilis TaxID=1423 RepID=A0A0D1KMU8_BACIU|nr:transcriptional repressor of carbon supply (LacI family) protein [Bacillus subtilis]